MFVRLIGTTRRARIFGAVFFTVAIMVVAASMAIGQNGVTGTDDKATGSTAFTVAGDGSLPTKRPTLGDTRDQLSTEEAGYAIRIASTDASIPAEATDVRGAAGAQVLYADIPDSDVDAGGRKALVVLYDYSHNRAYRQLVDLNAGTVTRSKSSAQLQPPIAADEADVAIDIALKADKPPRFVADFARAEGVPLVSPEQVNYIAAAWSHDGTTVSGTECGTDRCARLVVSTAAGTYLNTADFVVDLSAKRLVRLKPR